MADQDPLIRVSTEGGKLRVDLSATTIEADNTDSLIVQLCQLKKTLEDFMEEIALRDLEARSPGPDVLERLAARHPAPQQWYEEPD